jgi:hypothetical protein
MIIDRDRSKEPGKKTSIEIPVRDKMAQCR